MTNSGGYELDMSSPVSHAATEMERAGSDGPAPSIRSMAATYQHPIRGDLARIRRHESVADDEEAVLWLLRRAVEDLGSQVARDGDGYRLAKPFSELRWSGRPVPRIRLDDHARLGDPFNPFTGGVFAANIRTGKGHKRNPPEDTVLRESMRQAGWLPGHPAIVDERGVVITGHRRLRIAEELRADGVDIADDVLPVTFGSGDAADIRRLRAAWWSNEGSKGYTPEDRKAMVVYLRERGWTQASIAEALHAAQSTISGDLRDQPPLNIGTDNQSNGRGGRRQGAGRPRKARKIDDPELQRDIRGRVERHEPTRRGELAAKHGVSENIVSLAEEQVRGAMEAIDQPSWELIAELIRRLSADDQVLLRKAVGWGD